MFLIVRPASIIDQMPDTLSDMSNDEKDNSGIY